MSKLRTLEVTIQPGKVFALDLYPGASIVAVEERAGQNPRLLILEEFSDQFEKRKFVFIAANDETDVPMGAVFVAAAKQGYWNPFALFEVTYCDTSELE
ncbi:hypothetical protein [Burkholderia phage FLC9]|nr:hypothetical protein [Burkholderia phage FLC9]